MKVAVISALIGLGVNSSVVAAAPSGEEVYQKRCSTCHEQLTPRIPHREVLQKMPAARILRALDSGAMMSIAFVMSRDDRRAVASYLGSPDTIAGPPPSAFCANRTVTIAANPTGWNGWSPGTSNARFQTGDEAGLTTDQVKRLTLKWAFGFEGDVTAFAQPTVLDGHVFVGSAGGTVQAMRAESGCLEWTFQANGPVRSAIVAAPRGNRHALLFGDMTGWFYAVEAQTGKI
jgi:polyvinyl alcohol dehydrogenase (cytochrome)